MSTLEIDPVEDGIENPAAAAIFYGISMMLDMKGLSDELVDELKEKGYTPGAKALRSYIQKAASAIESGHDREHPPPGYVGAKVWVSDNADFRLFARVFSALPIANILLGYEKEHDAKHFDEKFIRGISPPTESNAQATIATEEDDKVAMKTIRLQNAYALLQASIYAKAPFLADPNSVSQQLGTWKPGDDVSFTYRHNRRNGKVKAVSGSLLTVDFKEANGDTNTVNVGIADATRVEDETTDSSWMEAEARAR